MTPDGIRSLFSAGLLELFDSNRYRGNWNGDRREGTTAIDRENSALVVTK